MSVRSPVRRALRPETAVALAVLTLPLAAELLHWRASRHLRNADAGSRGISGSEAVIVLGYRATRSGRLHPLQRWRTEIAVRSMDSGRDGRLVFTGAGRGGSPSEAATMAAYARAVLGVPADRIILETEARNTWQNIELTLPLVEDADTIKIASDPMHAARARRYLRRQRPDLADRLVSADDYRFLERWWLKIPTAAYESAVRAARRVLRG